jgi:hypothetical protein
MFNVVQSGESGERGLILGETTARGVCGKFGESGIGIAEKWDPDVPERGTGE